MPTPLAPGQRLRLKIDRLSLGGEGVGRHEGQVLFVPFAAPGDELDVEVTRTEARFARARLLSVVTPGPDRTLAPCAYHFQPPHTVHPHDDARRAAGVNDRFFCGGCVWQHLRYAGQLDAKRALVAETLERLGGLKGLVVKPVLGMKDPWRYRNKVQQPIGFDAHRGVITGFYAPDSHDIVPIEDCLVQPPASVALVNQVRALLKRYDIRPYDEARHQGWLRHVLVRTASDGAMLLVFVTRTPDFPHEPAILKALAADFPSLAGVHQNVHPAKTNVILGRQWRGIAGSDFLEERLGPLRFRLGPGSFFQINSRQAEALYDVTKRMAGRGRRLLDLYCGVGTIALWLADQFEEVGGIEEFPGAIDNAEANAELNGIGNARFMATPAEAFLRNASPDDGRDLVVTLDPPRAGCSPEVLRGLARLRPQRIVYVSCDPGTLARDLAFLVKAGYRVDDVQPVDLFPQTAHIETAVRLTRE